MGRPKSVPEGRTRLDLTQDELKGFLDYDKDTGIFTWKVDRNQNVKCGDIAGATHIDGYRIVSVRGGRYTGHRLAWLYHYGTWPDGDLDHRNGNPADNWIDNLRLANDTTNSQNKGLRVDNVAGFKGVTHANHPAHDGREWRARIRINGQLTHLGYFYSPEEAHAAYQQAAKTHFGEFARFA